MLEFHLARHQRVFMSCAAYLGPQNLTMVMWEWRNIRHTSTHAEKLGSIRPCCRDTNYTATWCSSTFIMFSRGTELASLHRGTVSGFSYQAEGSSAAYFGTHLSIIGKLLYFDQRVTFQVLKNDFTNSLQYVTLGSLSIIHIHLGLHMLLTHVLRTSYASYTSTQDFLPSSNIYITVTMCYGWQFINLKDKIMVAYGDRE